MSPPPTYLTPSDIRSSCRSNQLTVPSTAGLAPGYVQANVLILPSRVADDFRRFCTLNPIPCPYLGETVPGQALVPQHLARDSDIRTDCPRYTVYKDGEFIGNRQDVLAEWQHDSIAFLIGCSFSFEAALIRAGLKPRHIELGRNVPMYKTKILLEPAGGERLLIFIPKCAAVHY
jgi:uncharacterized protein YcsI (UPF0317 family)